MRKYKLGYMQRMVYRMPRELRESDQSLQFPDVDVHNGIMRSSTRRLYYGQFGILQYTARCAHLLFNLPFSGLNRGLVSIPKLVTKLMELQRGFKIDLSLDRDHTENEHVRHSIGARVDCLESLPTDILSCNEVLEPFIEAINLNKRLLQRGVDCPRDLENEVMRIAHHQIIPFLEHFPVGDPDLAPIKSDKHQNDDGSDTWSVADSMNMNFGSIDTLSINDDFMADYDGISQSGVSLSSWKTRRSRLSVSSKKSRMSKRSAHRSSRDEVSFEDDSAMLFIPFAVKLYTVCADACCDVSSWHFFEKEVRSMIIKAVSEMGGGDPESPFIFLDMDPTLRQIVECSMSMAVAEERGDSSRDSALQLAGKQGELLGLNAALVHGMLAVGNKTPQSRLSALKEMGSFLSKVNEGVRDNAEGNTIGLIDNPADSQQRSNKMASEALSNTISGLISLVTGDFEGGRPMALKLGGFDVKVMRRVHSFVSALHRIGLEEHHTFKKGFYDPLGQLRGTLDQDKIFQAFDKDKSGLMSFDEYVVMNKYMTYPQRLSTGMIVRIFKRADRDRTDTLSPVNFKNTFEIYADEITKRVLSLRQLSDIQLAKNLAREVFNILFVVAFVITGAKAFSSEDEFRSTVNSLMQIILGFGSYYAGMMEQPMAKDLEDDVERVLLALSAPV